MSATQSEHVDLTTQEVADLFGFGAGDVAELTTSTLRLPAAWLDEYRVRTGSQDLNVGDLCVVLGVSERTAWRYFAAGSVPRLRHRIGVVGGRRGKAVSPANLILFLRERNRLAGAAPEIRETPGQRARRGKDAQARAAAMCGD